VDPNLERPKLEPSHSGESETVRGAQAAIPTTPPGRRAASESSHRGTDRLSLRAKRRGRALALPFGSTPLDSDEGRAFLQQRLGMFSKVLFQMGAFAWLATLGIQWVVSDHHSWSQFMRDGSAWHLLGVAVSLFTWQIARSRPLSLVNLLLLDGLGTFAVLAAYSQMGFAGAGQAPERASFLMMLITMCTVTLRAITVPSTPGHTLLVTGVSSIPVLALTYYAAAAFPEKSDMPPLVTTAFMSIWVFLCFAIAGVASRVIYGLRVQVAEAQRLGQYVLDELIGEGGMGMVYRASHALLRRPTAIKLLLPERAGTQHLQRFEREVQLTAMLTHPNTISIFDYGHTSDGVFYYAMEYLDGIDLEQLVSAFGPQPSERVAYILEQVAGSLAEAHSVGLVHRDIKPANIILCQRGGISDVAKVVDFGLVKDANELRNADPTLTNANSILGTPLYLAPEAILTPDNVDARSDLYALGAVGYFLLTGQPVFLGGSVVEVCVQHVHAEPVLPSERLGQPVAAALEAIILRCLAKRPEDRPQSAEVLRELLATSGVCIWPRETAAAWWKRHAADITRARQARRCNASTAGRDTLAVDLVDRDRRRAP
jgi:serine/threonine-protein kinase